MTPPPFPHTLSAWAAKNDFSKLGTQKRLSFCLDQPHALRQYFKDRGPAALVAGTVKALGEHSCHQLCRGQQVK